MVQRLSNAPLLRPVDLKGRALVVGEVVGTKVGMVGDEEGSTVGSVGWLEG